MRRFSVFLIGLLLLFSLMGCGGNNTVKNTTGKPTAEEVLKENENADIFQLDGTIYKTNVDWVSKLELAKEEEIGEIKSTFSKKSENTSFHNGMATKLPKGTKIYSVDKRKDVLIVEFNGKEKKYLALSEG